MTASAALLPAVGGTRHVPAPDPIAADYILLALRLDQHIPGLVGAYFGPAELKAKVDIEQLRAPARLRDDVASLGDRVAREVGSRDRREWLTAQLVALDAHVRALTGDPLPYLDYVARCMGVAPRRQHDAAFDDAAAVIDALLPGRGALAERLAAWDRQLEIPLDRLPSIAEWLVERFRERAASELGVPDGASVRVALVRGQPWSAYDWYLGGRRSRVDINVDLPVTASEAIVTIAHETYPGHHLESSWKDTELVERRQRLEASIVLTNTPEGVISEGVASFGATLACPLDERADLIAELCERAGIALADDGPRARETAERAVALAGPRGVLDGVIDEAALRLHADGLSRAEVLTYLRDVGRFPGDVAARRLAIIEDRLSRLYVFACGEGDRLISRWVGTAEAPDRLGRFGRLLREQVTPGRLLAELG